MDVREAHRGAADAITARIETIGAEQWDLPTPCTEWDVRALVNHLVYGNLWVPPLVRGETIEQVGDRFEGEVLGPDPASAWKESARGACQAFEKRGALDRTVHLSHGDVPAGDYAEERFMDLLVHGWDLSRAIGADESMDPELVERCFQALAPRERAWRAGGALGPDVATRPGADRRTELLARFGRVA